MAEFAFEIYPKAVPIGTEQKIFIKFLGDAPTGVPVSIKIQGTERYELEHTPLHRIDEEDRYPFAEMEEEKPGIYSISHIFSSEQKYNIKIKVGEEILKRAVYVYAVGDDLRELDVFKMDTHLHTNRSDGEGTPFEVGVAYRRAGYDVIAITDHHKMPPSVEAKEIFEGLTERFSVIRAEEVHNKDMGYFHIINLGGAFSVNEIIEADDEYVDSELRTLIDGTDFGEADPYNCAYRTFVANEIHKGGGLAVIAHPFWECYGEYNMQTADLEYLLRAGSFDALELLAGCDRNNNGNNLQVAKWHEMRENGIKIPVLGASDSHSTTRADSLFNKQFTLAFARDKADIFTAIKEERTVAVLRRSDSDFFVFGSFRLVKYARFLLDFYYPEYCKLTDAHAQALALSSADKKAKISAAEEKIDEFKRRFFA